MRRPELTKTQLGWIILALQHELVRVREEMDVADDGSPIIAIGECVLETRKDLIDKLEDAVNGGCKTIAIK